jgi:hypothetical protein
VALSFRVGSTTCFLPWTHFGSIAFSPGLLVGSRQTRIRRPLHAGEPLVVGSHRETIHNRLSRLGRLPAFRLAPLLTHRWNELVSELKSWEKLDLRK